MDEKTKLNKNSEFVGKCLHKRKFRHGRIKDTSDIDLLKGTIQEEGVAVELEVGRDSGLVELRRSCRNRKANARYEDPKWAK